MVQHVFLLLIRETLVAFGKEEISILGIYDRPVVLAKGQLGWFKQLLSVFVILGLHLCWVISQVSHEHDESIPFTKKKVRMTNLKSHFQTHNSIFEVLKLLLGRIKRRFLRLIYQVSLVIIILIFLTIIYDFIFQLGFLNQKLWDFLDKVKELYFKNFKLDFNFTFDKILDSNSLRYW